MLSYRRFSKSVGTTNWQHKLKINNCKKVTSYNDLSTINIFYEYEIINEDLKVSKLML